MKYNTLVYLTLVKSIINTYYNIVIIKTYNTILKSKLLLLGI